MPCPRPVSVPVQNADPEVVFREALAHCRWTKVLRQTIDEKISLNDFNAQMSFEEVFSKIYSLVSPIKGMGPLVCYDLTSGICALYKIPITKVYIVGKGPIRAVQLLGLRTKSKKIGEFTIRYLEIEQVISIFKEKGFQLDEGMESRLNGDEFESFLCNWQKGK